LLNRRAERLLPFWIKICIGFIEQNQFSVAEERPRQADALALTTG
jgi:hypothetical protein